MLLIVVVLGAVAVWHSELIHEQTEIMYEHPLKVSAAVQKIHRSILEMRLGTRNLMLAANVEQINNANNDIEIASRHAEDQFLIVKEAYLGPQNDVIQAHNAFMLWSVSREENKQKALDGNFADIKQSVADNGKIGKLRTDMISKLSVIENFANDKADTLFKNSNNLKKRLHLELAFLIIFLIALIVILNYYLLNNIRKPITMLTNAALALRNGNLKARSNVKTGNELGTLSEGFDTMIDKLEEDIVLNEMETEIITEMLRDDDPHKFFSGLVTKLAELTNSQMVSVYLLTNDRKSYEHFESVGLSESARSTFSAEQLDGEFGKVVKTKKIQHLQNIPHDTRFVFNSVSGSLIPREIISVPIINSRRVIAVISMASVRKYSERSNLLINRIYDVMSARIDGILTYMRLKILAAELEIQKKELSAQSVELIQQNSELEMQKIQLNEMNKIKTNFLSNMSHELRTPLNSVIALSGVLTRKLSNKISDDDYSYLEVISRNGKQLLELINDILDLSRIEAGREELITDTFDINLLVSDIVNMIKPQADEKNIQLFYTTSVDKNIIESDERKIRHILQNLIGNAVKFTDIGKVEVSLHYNENNMQIDVTDTGVGIEKDKQEYIFDEFRQADGSTSRRFGGTGLGLSIARKYARMLGGDVFVNSSPGHGSVFTLIFPLADQAKDYKDFVEEKAKEQAFLSPAQQMSTNGKTILLVEDSEPAVIQLTDFLCNAGYKTLVAVSGDIALDIIAHNHVDAVILDLMLPVMDGFDVLRKIRGEEITSKLPVLILTAKHITKEELSFLKSNHIYQLIQKGDVNRDELLKTVFSMINI